jgi:hypothetical protein
MQDVAEVETGSGSIREAILKVANRQKADLIMLGRTRLGTPGLGLQPHILKFDNDAPCPVLRDRRTKFKIEVGFDTLLGDRFRYTLAMSPFKLTGQQVAKPSL